MKKIRLIGVAIFFLGIIGSNLPIENELLDFATGLFIGAGAAIAISGRLMFNKSN